VDVKFVVYANPKQSVQRVIFGAPVVTRGKVPVHL